MDPPRVRVPRIQVDPDREGLTRSPLKIGRQLRQVTLRGQHAVLEPLELHHAEELWPVAREPGLFDHLSPGAGRTVETLRAWIARRKLEEDLDLVQPFLIRDAAGKAVGSTSYMGISVRNKHVEIGHTWIAKSHRRTALNTEVKLLMLQHAFEDWHAIRVQFKTDVRNERAQKALERIGAVREGVMRRERVLVGGFVRDAAVYSIVDAEWNEVQARLNRLLYDR